MIVLFKYSQPFISIPIFIILLIAPSIQKLSFAQAPIKSEKWAGAELQEIERVIENTNTGKKIQFVLKKDGTINTDLRVVDGAEISENARWLSSGNGSLTINVETKGSAKNVSWTKNHIEDLKLQPNGECSGSIKITFTVNANGRTFSQKMEGRVRYRVVFSSKPDEHSITEMPHMNSGGGLSDAERQFDREVLAEIRRIIRENPNSWAITHQNIADQIRRGRGQNGGRMETPQMVAVEHYFFGLTLSPIASLLPADGAEIAHWWESIRAIGGNPGPRGNFQGRIEFWGGAGLNGWQVK